MKLKEKICFQKGDIMNLNLVLTYVMITVAFVFLILSFIFPSEIRIGSFVASLIIALVFYSFYKKKKKSDL